ncbi:MAG: hypothetical protein R2860_16310 [Desulfobacterales bacterium]
MRCPVTAYEEGRPGHAEHIRIPSEFVQKYFLKGTSIWRCWPRNSAATQLFDPQKLHRCLKISHADQSVFLSLIHSPDDPLGRQVIPDVANWMRMTVYPPDPLNEPQS